jgi:TolA-binding protein
MPIPARTHTHPAIVVLAEEELDRLRDHQLKFEELRNAELIETQRLEEQARRRQQEKTRRLEQQEEVARREREAAKKIAARSFAQSYVPLSVYLLLCRISSVQCSATQCSAVQCSPKSIRTSQHRDTHVPLLCLSAPTQNIFSAA